MEKTHTGAVNEIVQPVRRIHVGEVHGGLSPVGAGRSVRSPPSEEKGVAETCDELTMIPIPHPQFLWGEEMEKFGSEVQAQGEGARTNGFYGLVLFFIILLCFD